MGSPNGGVPGSFESRPIAIQTVANDARDPRNEALTELYALLAGADGCGSAVRSARPAHDDERVDLLSRSQVEILRELIDCSSSTRPGRGR